MQKSTLSARQRMSYSELSRGKRKKITDGRISSMAIEAATMGIQRGVPFAKIPDTQSLQEEDFTFRPEHLIHVYNATRVAIEQAISDGAFSNVFPDEVGKPVRHRPGEVEALPSKIANALLQPAESTASSLKGIVSPEFENGLEIGRWQIEGLYGGEPTGSALSTISVTLWRAQVPAGVDQKSAPLYFKVQVEIPKPLSSEPHLSELQPDVELTRIITRSMYQRFIPVALADMGGETEALGVKYEEKNGVVLRGRPSA